MLGPLVAARGPAEPTLVERRWPRSSTGDAHRRPDRRLRRRAAGEGRDRRASSPRSCARCCAFAEQVDAAGRPTAPVVDTCGTGGDRSPHHQRVDDGRARRRRRRRAGRASTATGPRRRRAARPTCSRRSASRSTSARTGVARCVDEAGHRVLLRAAVPPGDALRRPGPHVSSGVPTTFNFLGPLANPAGVRRQVVGVSRPGDGRAHGRRARRARRRAGAGRSTATTGSTSSRPRRRSTVYELDDGDGARPTRSTRSTLGLARCDRGDLVGGDAAGNAEIAQPRARRRGRSASATSSC